MLQLKKILLHIIHSNKLFSLLCRPPTRLSACYSDQIPGSWTESPLHHACTTDEGSTSFSVTDSVVDAGAVEKEGDYVVELSSYDVQAVIRTHENFLKDSKSMSWESKETVGKTIDLKKPKDVISDSLESEIQPATDGNNEQSTQINEVNNEDTKMVPMKSISYFALFTLIVFMFCSVSALIVIVVLFVKFNIYEFGVTCLVPVVVCGAPAIGVFLWSTRQFIKCLHNNKLYRSYHSRKIPLRSGEMASDSIDSKCLKE